MPIDRLATRTSNESYRYYFVDPIEYRRAMERAAYLESVNCPLRAWRVRMNLDGAQPTYAPAGPEDEREVEGLPIIELRKPPAYRADKPRNRNRKLERERRVLRLAKEKPE
jgi:hypothetical protein